MSDLSSTNYWGFNHGDGDGAAPGSAAGGAEVVAFDAARGLVFVLGPDGVDALDAGSGALRFSLPKADLGDLGTGNSVAVGGDLVAVAFDGPEPGGPGAVAFYRLDAEGGSATLLRTVEVGAVPDMAVFTPDSSRVLVAIEGEPTEDYGTDPAGGIAVIDAATGEARFAGFDGFDTEALRASGVRITGPEGTTAATDLEPEYIALSPDGRRAYVALQENNAVGVLDLEGAGGPAFTAVAPLGTKDHSRPGSGMDASDRDGGVDIETWPVQGLYMPDAIAAFERDGRTYLVTANEGDGREYGDYEDAARVQDLALDPGAFPDAAALQADAALGRLEVSTADGDTDGDGDYDALYSFGARSFSIWEIGEGGGVALAFDSGDLIERTLAAERPDLLDDGRSDAKGPEPEHVALGSIDGQLYAFVGLERADSAMAFRIDGPRDAAYEGIIAEPGDAAPETFAFAADAPGGGPFPFVANEVSGTSRAFALGPGGDFSEVDWDALAARVLANFEATGRVGSSDATAGRPACARPGWPPRSAP